MQALFCLLLLASSALALPRRLQKRSPTLSVKGTVVTGFATTSAVDRFTLPYAQPPIGSLRFKSPIAITELPNAYDASTLQSACPQQGGLTYSTNEDCLYLNVFKPALARSGSKLPVMVWLHGGSRSATDVGLDGSVLAASGVIVITVEYRQGVLGFLKEPSLGIPGNQGLRDILLALTMIRQYVSYFGGDPSQITLAGQSTGASLIRTLLATPKADNLFHRVILQSGPFDYGDQSASIATRLGSVFLSEVGCKTLSCLQTTSVAHILSAQEQAVSDVATSGSSSYMAAVSQAEPYRPYVDGTLVKGNIFGNSHLQLTNTDRPMLMTTVHDEGGADISVISASFTSDGQPAPIPATYEDYIITYLLTPTSRSKAVEQSGMYNVDKQASDGTRNTLNRLATDYVFRCPNQQAAVNLTRTRQAPKIYLGEFHSGIQYPTNANISYCSDLVCHEDDILAVFGTASTSLDRCLSTNQKALQNEVMARWLAFIKSGNPNTSAYPNWKPVKSATHLNLLALGNKTVTRTTSVTSVTIQQEAYNACQSLWKKVPFDVKLYGP